MVAAVGAVGTTRAAIGALIQEKWTGTGECGGGRGKMKREVAATY